jgi:DNA polymerase-3 subunit beta
MESKINREDLLLGLHRSQSIVEKRSSMPILSNVLLRAESDRLTITATDLEISFQGRFPAQVDQEGAVTVPARKLFEIIKSLASEDVFIKEKENNYVQISGGRAEYELVGLTAEEFPTLASFEGLNYIEISPTQLKEMIDKTAYAVSTEETRYNLAGVFWEETDDDSPKALRMVATDGHRLSLIEQEVANVEQLNLDKGIIIPRKGIQELRRLTEDALKSDEAQLKVAIGDNSCIVVFQEMILIMRLMDGTFPDYKLVIPKTIQTKLDLDRMDFLETLNRMSILSTDKYRGVKFKLSGGMLELISSNPDLGESREGIEVDYQGEEKIIGFNPRFFIDLLTNLNSDRVTLNINDDASPAMVTAENDPGFLSVVMPMRI